MSQRKCCQLKSSSRESKSKCNTQTPTISIMARMKFVLPHLPYIQIPCMFELVSSNYRNQHTRDSTQELDVKGRDHELNTPDKNYKTQEVDGKEKDSRLSSPDINIPELLHMLESTDQMEFWLQQMPELTYSPYSDKRDQNDIPSYIRQPSFEELSQDAISHAN